MAEKTITLKVEIDDTGAVKAVENLTKAVDQTKDAVDETKDAAKGMKKSFEGVGLAIKAMGIGLLLKAFDAFFDVLSNNQTVMNAFSTAAETVSIFLNDIVQSLVDTYNAVMNATDGFDATRRVITNLISIALTPLKLQFYAIKLAVQEAQLIWEQSFFGDDDPETVKQLNDAITQTKKDIIDTGAAALEAGKQIGNDFSEMAGEFGTLTTTLIDELSDVSLSAAYEQGKVNTELSRTAERLAADNRLLLEQYDIQAEKLRQIVDDETKSIDERIRANEMLGDVLMTQQQLMSDNAQALVDAAAAQYEKNQSDENYIALQESLAEQLGIVAQIEGIRSGQMTEQNALIRERIDLMNEMFDDFDEAFEEQLDGFDDYADERLAKEKTMSDESVRIYQEGKNNEAQIDAAAENEKASNRKQAVSDGLSAASSALNMLADLYEGDFEKQKKIRIAAATVDTIQGAISAYMGAQSIPIVGTVIGAVLAALVLAMGFKNIQKIKQSTPQNAGAGASFGGGSTPSIPNIQMPNQTAIEPITRGESRIAAAVETENAEPVRAYVVSTEMTSQQDLDRRVEANATF